MSTPTKFVDLRSDTVTKPTAEMLQAMVGAEVGDDVLGDDVTVIKLQEKVAELCGTESALFVCSGVMGNQISIRCLAGPMQEVICDARSHIYSHENGGVAYHTGAQIRPIKPKKGKTHITAEQIQKHLCLSGDVHETRTTVIALENTISGAIMPIEEIKKISDLAKKHNIKMHLDGARIWNASIESGVSMTEYCQYFDTVSMCLSKALGCPVGSVVVSSRKVIDQARYWRKAFGGGLRQVGLLAAAGIYAIDNHLPLLKQDHVRAKKLAAGLKEQVGFDITNNVETNMMWASCENLGKQHGVDLSFTSMAPILKENEKILVLPEGKICRLVVHFQVSEQDIDHIIGAFHRVTRQLLSNAN